MICSYKISINYRVSSNKILVEYIKFVSAEDKEINNILSVHKPGIRSMYM